LLQRSVPSQHIGTAAIRYAGTGTIAFVELIGLVKDARAAGEQAILDLDGELLLGQALRVSWRELDPAWLAEQFGEEAGACPFSLSPSSASSTAFLSVVPHLAADSYNNTTLPRYGSKANAQPLIGNRYAQLAANEASNLSGPSPSPPPLLKSPRHSPSYQQSPSTRSAPIVPSPKAPSPALTDDEKALKHLSSLGVPPSTLATLPLLWSTSDYSTPPSLSSRRTTATVDFGFLPAADARFALEAKAKEKPYKDDPIKQHRYEAFLEAQAGLSRDWYTVRSFPLLPFFPVRNEFSPLSSAYRSSFMAFKPSTSRARTSRR
jgi:hypothetical protein